MQIPDKAVMAAAIAIERELLSGKDYSMAQDSDEALARVALEAAAPLIVAQHEREAWRPIAEAPRTPEHYDLPTYFLMWDGRCVFKGFRGQPPDNDPHWDPDPEFFDENSDGVETPPTHFRLLPSPPASEKERADG